MEFALLLPVIAMLLFGILDYGLWFNDSLSVRQAVREGARAGVVRHTATGCSGAGMAEVACGARGQMQVVSGATYAKAFAPNGWVRGEELVVCGMVKSTSFGGFVPLPAGGMIKSKTIMSIESLTPAPTDTSYADTPPSGADWSWCTP